MTVADLMAIIENMPEDAEIRIAQQPSWPLEYSIQAVEEVYDEENLDAPPVIYLVEGEQRGYLPGHASEALGWS